MSTLSIPHDSISKLHQMADRLAGDGSAGQTLAHGKKKATCEPGSRLRSDLETAAAPSLQFCMPTEDVSFASSRSILGRQGFDLSRVPSSGTQCPSSSSRGSSLTGNIFVDYRKYCIRRLANLSELQRCREAAAVGSLKPSCRRFLLSRHSGSITRLSLDHKRRYLLSSSRDCSLALYDLAADDAWDLNGGFGPEPKPHPIGFVQRRPDRPPRRVLHPLRFQAASQQPALRKVFAGNSTAGGWAQRGYPNLASSQRVQQGHWHSVTSVEFMPGDNGLFVSTGLDNVLKIWDTRAWECVLDIGVQSPVLCCSFDRASFQAMTPLNSRQGFSCGQPEQSLAASAQVLVAAGCQDGSIRIFDLRCGVAQQSLLGHSGAVLSTAWNSCAPYQLFSGSSDKSIRGWDVRRGDSCFVMCDKNKPDIEFIGNRYSQSAAFRQILKTSEFMGREYYGEVTLSEIREPESLRMLRLCPPIEKFRSLADMAVAAASAAFTDESSISAASSILTRSIFFDAESDMRAADAVLHQIQAGSNISSMVDPNGPGINPSPQPKQAKCRKQQAQQIDSSSRKIAVPRNLMGELELGGRVGRVPKAAAAPAGGSDQPGAKAAVPRAGDDNTHCRPVGLKSDASINMATACTSANDSDEDITKNVREIRYDLGNKRHMKASKRRLDSPIPDTPGKRPVASRAPPVPCHSGEVATFSALGWMDEVDNNGLCRSGLMNRSGKFDRDQYVTHSQLSLASFGKVRSAQKSAPEAQRGGDIPINRSTSPYLEMRTPVTSDVQSHSDGTGRHTSVMQATGQFLCKPSNEQAAAHASNDIRTGRITGQSYDVLGNVTRLFPRRSGHSGTISEGDDFLSEACAHDGAVTWLLPSTDGSFLISSGCDERIRVWNASNGCHCFVHMSFDVSPNNSCRGAMPHGGHYRSILHPPARIGNMSTAASKANSSLWGRQAAMSCGGKYVIHGRGRAICTYDVFTGLELQNIAAGHAHDVVCVTWNDQKGEAYSGASDGTIIIYDWLGASTNEEDEEDISDDEDIDINVVPSDFL